MNQTVQGGRDDGHAAGKPGVLYISAVSDFKGGAEVVMRSMLANPDVRPVLAVPDEGPLADAAQALGVQVCYYRPTSIMQVHRPLRLRPMLAAAADAARCSRRLRRLAREHGCDILHSNGLKPHMLCAMIGATSSAKTLVHFHDIPYRRVERLLWTAIARSVSRVIMVSRPCYPGATLPANAQVVWNGIRDGAMQRCRPPGRTVRCGLVSSADSIRTRGLDLLLDWFGAVRRAGLDATLTIRGRPDPDMPEYWTGIEERIRREGFDSLIKREGWTTGPATYAGIDVLLITSRIPDPAPLVVPEAMSAGVIVAGYPAGGIPDMIENGRTGFLVETGAAPGAQPAGPAGRTRNRSSASGAQPMTRSRGGSTWPRSIAGFGAIYATMGARRGDVGGGSVSSGGGRPAGTGR